MAIDICNIEPTVISRDLKGKFVCIYGLPKVGKTTLACQFPKNLLCGFEHGWNGLAGVRPQEITKWADFKLVLRQLEKPEAQSMYDTITLDTIGIAWDMCEHFICAQNGVQQIGDIPWGAGYKACEKEFESCLRKITQLGYGLVIIAHVDKRIEKRADETEVAILGPSIPKRAYNIVNQLVDIIGYIDTSWNENGESERWLYTRKTPTVMAGSRFKYLAPKIKFGYQELVDAVSKALEMSVEKDGAVIVDKQAVVIEQKRSFKEVRDEAMQLWNKLVGTGDNQNVEMATEILKKVEMVFGRKMKLSEITEDQIDLFELVIEDMKSL